VVAGVEEPIAAEAGVIRIPEAGATIATEAEEDPHTEEARDNDERYTEAMLGHGLKRMIYAPGLKN